MAAPSCERTSDSAPSLTTVSDKLSHQITTASVTDESLIAEKSKECLTDDNKVTTATENTKEKSASFRHNACLRRIKFASEYHPNVKFLLEVINNIGSEFIFDKQVHCEKCTDDNNVSGGFDPNKNEIIVCENRSPTQRLTSMLLTHELVHAYDHAKAKVDWTDLRAVACSEIRAANLSGDCSFLSEKFYRSNIGARYNHKACVRRLAVSSIIATRDLTKEAAEEMVDSVWGNCFHDYAPFTDIPHKAADMKFSRFSKYYDPR